MPKTSKENRLTFTSAKAELQALGVVITKSAVFTDEYRVRLKADRSDAHIYYTQDLKDAYDTGKRIAQGNDPMKPKLVANVDQQIQACAQERVKEFHRRLNLNVQKLVCDLEKHDQTFLNYVDRLTLNQVQNLAIILRKELLQVVDAVNNAQ